MTHNRQERHYDPQRPLYPGLNAHKLLDEVLWDLASDETGPVYPEDGELDDLAPDLKRLVMEQADGERQPLLCRHLEAELSSMSHDIIERLPRGQRERIRRRMRGENP